MAVRRDIGYRLELLTGKIKRKNKGRVRNTCASKIGRGKKKIGGQALAGGGRGWGGGRKP